MLPVVDQEELERLLGVAPKAVVLTRRRSGKTVALAHCMRRVAQMRPDLGLALIALTDVQEECFARDYPDLAQLLTERANRAEYALFLDEPFFYQERVLDSLLDDGANTHIFMFATVGFPDHTERVSALETHGFLIIEAPLL